MHIFRKEENPLRVVFGSDKGEVINTSSACKFTSKLINPSTGVFQNFVNRYKPSIGVFQDFVNQYNPSNAWQAHPEQETAEKSGTCYAKVSGMTDKPVLVKFQWLVDLRNGQRIIIWFINGEKLKWRSYSPGDMKDFKGIFEIFQESIPYAVKINRDSIPDTENLFKLDFPGKHFTVMDKVCSITSIDAKKLFNKNNAYEDYLFKDYPNKAEYQKIRKEYKSLESEPNTNIPAKSEEIKEDKPNYNEIEGWCYGEVPKDFITTGLLTNPYIQFRWIIGLNKLNKPVNIKWNINDTTTYNREYNEDAMKIFEGKFKNFDYNVEINRSAVDINGFFKVAFTDKTSNNEILILPLSCKITNKDPASDMATAYSYKYYPPGSKIFTKDSLEYLKAQFHKK
ncbi:MAG: hypothetical protein K0R49_741 [Burkholderiales bacterium]|nr:hypothetical protein [Burkholderiales bacterium]